MASDVHVTGKRGCIQQAVAAVIAVVLFTLGHAYQGKETLGGIAFVSACFVGLYLLTGSLLLPIVFHALLDLLQGQALSRFVVGGDRAGALTAA